jgi:hypothetical protein
MIICEFACATGNVVAEGVGLEEPPPPPPPPQAPSNIPATKTTENFDTLFINIKELLVFD